MKERRTQLALLSVFILTVFSIIVVYPSDPDRYLPDFIPWPKEKCVASICIGKGVDIPFVTLEGSSFGVGRIERREMRLGLDLRGGTRLVLEADTSGQPGVNLSDAMNTAVDIVERRVNEFGVAESITERIGSNRISVQLPGISADEAIQKIGRTAQLQFMELACQAPDGGLKQCSSGDLVYIKQADGTFASAPFEQVLQDRQLGLVQAARFMPVTAVDSDGVRREITGTYLDRGKIFITQSAIGLPVLQFGMNSTGAKLLSLATRRLSEPNQPMAFFLDNEPILGADGAIVAPFVRSEISDAGIIDGLSLADAQILQKLLRTGAFPVPLRVVQQEDVDATLGDQAVVDSVQAGLIAIMVVMLFMLLYYRLPGALASLALFVYVFVTLMVFKLVPVTITSAGVAAFVLSVGMAVDANILIFERMKEELRLGRSLVGAIDAGFSRAWTSIRDSNIATLITCTILFWFGDQFGASLVKGFALTLALGVLVSMFSAIFVTRTLLRTMIGTTVMRHLWLFGADVVEARSHLPAAGGLGRATPQTPRSPHLP